MVRIAKGRPERVMMLLLASVRRFQALKGGHATATTTTTDGIVAGRRTFATKTRGGRDGGSRRRG